MGAMANRFSPATWADPHLIPHAARVSVWAGLGAIQTAWASASISRWCRATGTLRISGSAADGENPPTPATGGGAPGPWHPRRSATAWRTKRCAMGRGSLLPQQVSRRGDPGEEPQQYGRGAGDGQVGLLALGLHAQMGPHLLKGDPQLPAQHRPFLDPHRVHGQVGARQTLCGESPWGSRTSTRRRGTGGRPARYHTAAGEVSSTVRVVPSHQSTGVAAQDRPGWGNG